MEIQLTFNDLHIHLLNFYNTVSQKITKISITLNKMLDILYSVYWTIKTTLKIFDARTQFEVARRTFRLSGRHGYFLTFYPRHTFCLTIISFFIKYWIQLLNCCNKPAIEPYHFLPTKQKYQSFEFFFWV